MLLIQGLRPDGVGTCPWLPSVAPSALVGIQSRGLTGQEGWFTPAPNKMTNEKWKMIYGKLISALLDD